MSPYARRITWYLNLRKIPHATCPQPIMPPRPDLSSLLGLSYRRIPVLAIGRDIYLDTRLILSVLSRRFPASDPRFLPLSPATTPNQRALQKLLGSWTVDGGIFDRMAHCIPLESALLSDPKFVADRESFTGWSWDKAEYAQVRPEALVDMRQAFGLLEDVLSDGRAWILGTETPSLGDIEAVWPFDWLAQMDGALPADVISARLFPSTYAWLERFRGAVREAAEAAEKRSAQGGASMQVKGEEAWRHIVQSEFAEAKPEFDEDDPTGLTEGAEVQLWPTDSGFTNKDQGTLVGLTKEEVVISMQTKQGGEEIRIHAPRWGFRIREVDKSAKL
ncbi:MAG: hypothetical protein Q9157_005630 [Trypethelium eluteriae]